VSDDTTRKGKIARLPAKIREQVNLRLHDGKTGPQIIAWLHTQPEVLAVLDEHFHEEPITSQNLSEWRSGGYQDWKDRLEKVENLKQLSAYALELAQAGGSVSEGAAAVAGGKILEFLESADEKTIEGLALSLAKLRDSEAKLLAARTAEANLARKDRQLDLDEQRFKRTTAELFLKLSEPARQELLAIAAVDEPKKVKMPKMIQLLFGERPT
jgi:hypothetical protein